VNTGKIEQGARFEQLIKNLGYNQSSFAKAFGTHQTNISLIVKGHRSIPSRILIDISKRIAVMLTTILYLFFKFF
jgi:plasmid maintenance system antidote protein VapI